MTMFELSDFDITGSLREWDIVDQLKKLTPELVLGGPKSTDYTT
jgi:hypothetical protein